MAVVKGVEAVFDDLEAVDEHLGEEEREDADREHRQADAGSLRDELDSPEGQPQVDGEPRQRAEQDCLAEDIWAAE